MLTCNKMKNKNLVYFVVSFVFILFCDIYAQQSNSLDKAVFRFDVSSAELTIKDQDTIKRMAQKVSCLNLKILIESNTDITGTDEINIPLSQQRADVVKNYFMSLGVCDDDIQVISYAGTRPLNNDNTEDAYSQNRRTEVTLIDPKKEMFPKNLE